MTARSSTFWGLGLLYAVDGSGNLSVFHADGLGSIRALTDGSATLIATYQTDAWGNPTATGGSSTQPFRFAGEQLDADGLLYLRARFYEPATGRFIARDRLVASYDLPLTLSPYVYALNCPTTRVDPTGFKSLAVIDFLGDVPDLPSDLTPLGPALTLDLLRRNILLAETWRNYPEYLKEAIFASYVAPFRPWDYKSHSSVPAQWDAFGNLNYGATGSAAGIPEDVLLQRAGLAGWIIDRARQASGRDAVGRGLPWGGPPYGDNPDNQKQIVAGIVYYKSIRDLLGTT